tara:strand:- start:40 stop:270 length:231 start_codon:yes stop_codon:yes gene_type:complete
MKVTFAQPKKIIVVPERTKTISEVEILEITDSPQRKTITVNTDTIGMIVLWEGAEYDAIGQWTTTDIIARIKEIHV